MRSARPTASEGPLKSAALLALPLAAVAALAGALVPAAWGAAEPAAGPEPEATLTAIEAGPAEGAWTLVCRGSFRHRLVREQGGLLVSIQLPNVANAIPPDRIPPPGGLVKRITIDAGVGEPTRVDFTLARPAPAVATLNGRGLRLQIGDAGPGAARGASVETPVGPEDLLEISVFEIPDLNRTVRVSARGTISLPLLGETAVEGLTPIQLEARLREDLERKYLKDPQVSVFVREHGSRKISVLGAVGKPGVYEMLGPRTLLEVLSQAGGLTEDAGGELFVIRTAADGSGERIAVRVSDLMASGTVESNVPVEPGDIISVPIDRPIYIYVDGAVKSPGRIEQLASRPITLLQAIAKAGGVTERANLGEVQILRQSEAGTQTVLEVSLKRLRKGKDPDPTLRDGDIVVVSETFF